MISINQIQQWLFIKSQLDTSKEGEMKLRKEICTEVFKVRTGKFTEKLEQDGFKIKATSNVNVKFDSESPTVIDLLEQLNSIDAKQALLNAIGFFDPTNAECLCVKIKIELSKTALKLISDESSIYDMIIEEPATPTLEIKGE